MNRYRRDIEEIDQRIVELIDKRIGITKMIFEVKRREGRPIRDPEQEGRVLSRAVDLATEKNLDAGAIKGIYEILIQMSTKKQQELQDENQSRASERA
ncbi:MAG: chorismate mutase [Methanothrix sp.]|uniref:chorismate mutase n=1 Tax=Methanothrix sp. TaxID=90426 RepID=UPI002BC05F8D|nr:chorismate mutase [Methanothrix sp.]